MAGRLIICATPIGNLGDAPPRLGDALRSATVVFAEDTRRTAGLLTALGIERPLRSYFVGNERSRAPELDERLRAGETVALVSDAGTPAISDPGVAAVRVARRAGATVTVVPGPSAVTAALALSGMPAERFVFEGFLPRKGNEREERLRHVATEERTVVLFSSPHRLVRDLEDLGGVAGGDRGVFVAREITKHYEEAWWGTIDEARTEWTDRLPRGEFTLVIAAADPETVAIDEAVAAVKELVASGVSMSEAVRQVASDLGVRRRQLYEAVIDG